MRVHPLAVVHPTATIGQDIEIGPFCLIEPNVAIGNGCQLESRVSIKSGTILGDNNHIHDGAVLGGMPQHIHAPDRPGLAVIGSGNTIRENVTVHRALDAGKQTIIGDNNLLMVNAHVAHDCQVGNHTIITNNVMLAGHVLVADRAYLSGASGFHQFCRVGTLAMVGGQAHLVKDVPPYVVVDGLSSLVVGLNQVGLRRAGYQATDIGQLKAAYRVIYRSRLSWNDILARLKSEFPEGPASLFHSFLSTTTRGIVGERRLPPGATLKLRRNGSDEDEGDLKVQAG